MGKRVTNSVTRVTSVIGEQAYQCYRVEEGDQSDRGN